MASVYTKGYEIDFHDAVFRVYSIGFHEQNPSDAARAPDILHSHSYYEFHLISKGKTAYRLENRMITVSAGEILLLPPDCPHMSHIDGNPYTDTVFSLGLTARSGCGREFYRYFRERLNALSNRPLPIPEDAAEQLLHAAQELWDSPEFLQFENGAKTKTLSIGRYCEQKTELCNLLMLLFRSIGLFRDDAAYRQAAEGERNILLENMVYNFRFPLDRIAETLGYSVRYTSRIIHDYFGESLTSVRGRVRFASFRRILEEHPESSLESAGKKAGYRNPSALIRAVRSYAGCTPTELRRQIEKEQSFPEKQ